MEFHPDGKTRDSKRRGPTSVLDDSPTDVIEQALLVGFVGRKEQTGHPSQKPFKVYDQLLQMTVSDGGLILDPMCGSGTAGAVAKERGFRAILCDGSDEYTKLVEKRLGVKRLNITAEITNLLESVPPEAHAVVLLDGAGWHLVKGA